MSLSDAIKDELNSGKLPDLNRGRVVIRDVIDILYTDKWLRDLIYQKRQVINERSK